MCTIILIVVAVLLNTIIGSSGTDLPNKKMSNVILDELQTLVAQVEIMNENTIDLLKETKYKNLCLQNQLTAITQKLNELSAQGHNIDNSELTTQPPCTSLVVEFATLKREILEILSTIKVNSKSEIMTSGKEHSYSPKIEINSIPTQMNDSLGNLTKSVMLTKKYYPSCVEALQNGNDSGIYTMYLPFSGLEPFDVYCLRDPKQGDAWTVFQRRRDGPVDFYKNWQEYKTGFGDLAGDFFIGLEQLHALTNQAKSQKLWIKLTDWEGATRSARYATFKIGNKASKYTLTQLGGYSGDAGDSLGYHRGQKFSTKDSDNDNDDRNCAVSFKSAWWFNKCYESNLNAEYLPEESIQNKKEKGIIWYRWHGLKYSLKYVHMALRPSTKCT